ncbi:MAG: thiamine pyrophosphate-binding protein [Hyphomicrobiales bacterium]|nr:thiamine pyrophosphate-binding protein [Hyphomicrobiales bacterium]
MDHSSKVCHGGRVLVDQLALHGVDTIYGVPGESFLAALDGLHDARSIRFVNARQEGGAAIMADAYGKLTGKPGICFVTRGPGATNASAGVHIAYQDSTPMILLIGQVGLDMIEREAFQEVDYRRMFGQMAKWVAQIDDASRIPEYVSRAFYTATSGRPGPVVLALPEDMLSATVTAENARPVRAVESGPTPEALDELSEMLAKAERPVCIVGGGGWSDQTRACFEVFATAHQVPVGASFRCQDYFNNDHPNYAGHVGIGVSPNLAERIRESDLLLVAGARLGEMTTSGYSLIDIPAPKQPLVHVYPHPEELGRVYAPTLGIVSGMGAFGRALRNLVPRNAPREALVADAHADFAAYSQPTQSPGNVQMAEIMQHLRQTLPDDTIITNGAGNYAVWVHRFWQYRQYRTGLAPTSGSMGYGVPAAIAAKIHNPDRTVIAFAGDGCFQMTGLEFATAVQEKAAIIVLVVNNGMYATIRMHQERHYPGRTLGTDLINPDFAALARACGGFGATVEHTERFADAFAEARASGLPSIIELRTDPEALTPVATLSETRNQGMARKGG